MSALLAIDLGLKTGLALYGMEGRLIWYRSQNFGAPSRLKRAVFSLLQDLPQLQWLIVEGGGPLADLWTREAERRAIRVRRITAETWRTVLLNPREQRNGLQAKQHADTLARRVIEWSGARRPTSLRHDAAEAILIGLWGVLEAGLIKDMPPEIARGR